ncbi:hypothetical protein FRC14_006784 [Serendipita sp. 396]|nr:hypothetical protein FRC14_006784 [Serendipita sp. 396]
MIARRTLTLGIRGHRLIAVKTANRHTYANILAQAWTLTSSFEPPTPRHHHMAENLLDGWLALAAETRRVDRISSILGLDSPALQSSPSSLGTSCGSSGLNTPSQNVFRFLPLINDISPELLKTSLVDSLPASLSRSRSSSYNRSVPPRQIPSLNAVKDEEDAIDALNQTFPEFGEHRSRNQEDTPSAVEDEELRWWENDPVGSLTFDMDVPQPASKH